MTLERPSVWRLLAATLLALSLVTVAACSSDDDSGDGDDDTTTTESPDRGARRTERGVR